MKQKLGMISNDYFLKILLKKKALYLIFLYSIGGSVTKITVQQLINMSFLFIKYLLTQVIDILPHIYPPLNENSLVDANIKVI